MTAHRLRTVVNVVKMQMPDKIENGHICENIVQNRSQADFSERKKDEYTTVRTVI